ncbi:unnamed protein product [Caenorhabditis angaria]|uniref:C2H2-type domain-containing protein n=1 Tax=Caenorhabditis angaria TaxID=860376 RepID=A0A9P1I3E9_9PELO|nr:unnamed protein product [Caenorhabditis angaria]
MAKKSYIEVKIFGKSLAELEEDGYDLERILVNLGCRNVLISEVAYDSDSDSNEILDETMLIETSMPRHQSSENQSGSSEQQQSENSFSENSSSLSCERIPRCSTPRISGFVPSLWLSNVISRINSRENEKDDQIGNLLECLINIVVETEIENTILNNDRLLETSSQIFAELEPVFFQHLEMANLREKEENFERNKEEEDIWQDIQQEFELEVDSENNIQNLVENNFERNEEDEESRQEFELEENYDSENNIQPQVSIQKSIEENEEEEVWQDVGQELEENIQPQVLIQKSISKNLFAQTAVYYTIKCEFENCEKKYNWRPKFGKLRLFDHAMTHLGNGKISCNLCEYKGYLRALRVHIHSKHSDENDENISIQEIFLRNEMKKIWEKCFLKSLDLVGKPYMDNWLNYIQINVYGKRMEELNGIYSFLNTIGCDKFWMGEVPMYRGDSDSGVDSSFEDTEILNKTKNQAIQKFPRCSTPRDSRIGRTFTLGASQLLSKIASETSTEEFLEISGSINQSMEIIMENNEETEVMPISDSFDIQHKDIDVVSKPGFENDLSNFEDCNQLEIDEEIENREVVDDFGVQEQDLESISNLLKSVVEIICETETECDSSIFEDCQNLTFASVSSDFNSIAKSSGELPTFYGPHPAVRHSEIETKPTGNIIETKPRILTNRRVQNLKIPEKSIENENEKERKPLKRTTSEIRRNRRKAMKLLRNNTVVPNFDQPQSSNQFETKISIPRVKSRISEMDYDNLSYQSIPEQFENQNSTHFPISDDSERVFTDLTPFTSDGEQYCEIEQDFFEMVENRLNSGRTNQNEDSLMYNNSEEGGNEQESWVDQDIELDLDEEDIGGIEEVIKDEEEEEEKIRSGSSRKESEDDQNDSLLSAAVNDLSENENEEEEPEIPKKRTRKAKYTDEENSARHAVHNIKCEFEDCEMEYKWKLKYGKIRLIDHSMKHCQTRKYCCNFCDLKFDTLRIIRRHEIREHPDQQNGQFKVKEVLKTKIDHLELKNIWEKCYKSNLKIMDNWLNYVQINLYGKRVEELNIDGIREFLNTIGCDKFWMGEVPMYRGDSDSGVDSSFEDTVILNTSKNLEDQKYPRCSTPRISKIGRTFTLGASQLLSKIASETSTEEFLEISGSINQSMEIIMENNEETEVMPISDSFDIQNKDIDVVSKPLSNFEDCNQLEIDENREVVDDFAVEENDLESISNLLKSVVDIICETETECDFSIFEDCGNASFQNVASNQQLSPKITQINIEPKVFMNQLEVVDDSGDQDQDLESISNLLKSVVDIICETETECDLSIFEDCQNLSFSADISDFNADLPTFYGPHPAVRHSEIETKPTGNIIETKPRILTNQSVQNLKIPKKSIENEKERKPLKRTTSEIRRNRRKAMKLLRNNTVVPNFDQPQYSNQFESKVSIPRVKSRISEMDYDNLSYQSIPEQFENQNSTQFPLFDDSERVYTDLTPFTSDGEQYCEIEQDFFEMAENRLNSGKTNQNEDSLMYNNSEEGGNEQESWVDQDIELDLDEEEDRAGNEEEEENIGGESSRKESEDDQNDSLLSAALDDLSENEEEEEDEEKVGIQVNRRQKRCNIGKAEANKQYHINCQFKDCQYSIKWRPKFGKLRLLDHVLTHLPQKLIRCHNCDFTCQTSRQIRYHYKKQHQMKNKVNGYGIYEMFSLRVENDKTISQCWESCFKDKLDIIGKAVLKAARRRS